MMTFLEVAEILKANPNTHFKRVGEFDCMEMALDRKGELSWYKTGDLAPVFKPSLDDYLANDWEIA